MLPFLLLLAVLKVNGQTFTLVDSFPEVINDTNPIVSAVENAQNVTIYCAIKLTSDGSIFNTQWGRATTPGGMPLFLSFNPDGTAENTDTENYMVTPNPLRRRNLTIFVFDSSYDDDQITCGAGGEVVARFDLRIISKCVHSKNKLVMVIHKVGLNQLQFR